MDLGLETLSSITVFSKYAKHIPELQRRENWAEIVERYREMMLKKYPHIEDSINENIKYIHDKKVLPSMRALQFAGPAAEVNNSRIYNCFGAETKFITSLGVKSFSEFSHGSEVTVLTHLGNWKKAVVKNYGKQKLNKILVKRGSHSHTVRATANHRWILKDNSETTNLTVGDKLLSAPAIFDSYNYYDSDPLERLYWAYGYIFGDGTCVKNSSGEYKYSMVRLCGKDKSLFLDRFLELGFKTSASQSLNGDVIVYTGEYLKESPDPTIDNVSLIRAFVRGYLDADGGKNNSQTSLSEFRNILATGDKHKYVVEKLFAIAGVFISSKRDLEGKVTNYGVRKDSMEYNISTNLTSTTNMSFIIKEITEDEEEEVWCLEVEDDKSFVLEHGEVTGNCCYHPIDSIHSFSETMFLLLGGTGVGYSVQKQHVAKLPDIKKPGKARNYLIEDSIMGWADAVKVLLKAYLEGKFMPKFDFRAIRHKGARLVTAGGKAPGPEPLKICIAHVQTILDRKEEGERLTPLECHDILCHIANSVLSGGIRRSAMIALFSHDDEEMIACKSSNVPSKILSKEHPTYTSKIGLEEDVTKYNLVIEQNGVIYKDVIVHIDLNNNKFWDLEQYERDGTLGWWVCNEQRGRANNSAVLLRGAIEKEEFQSLWHRIELSNSGEPGIYWTNDVEWGTNPCVEIALRPFQFCNLCEINADNISSQEDLNQRARIAAFFGTLQAGFTDFHYLRPIWQRTTEKDALLGIGMTGIASKAVLSMNLTEAAEEAKIVNEEVSQKIGINKAARVTCVKPSGTTSCVLGTSSGIHAWHNDYYLRTLRFNKNEDLAAYLMVNHPELCEDDQLRPHDTVCVRIPIKAPEGSILRTETAIDTLERVKKFSQEWIKPGHINGVNSHNVSATISIDKSRMYNAQEFMKGNTPVEFMDEWEVVGEWMWDNKEYYNGLSVLPYFGSSFIQAPFEDITKEEYERRIETLKSIDLTQVVELDDTVDFGAIAACAGGSCEINL